MARPQTTDFLMSFRFQVVMLTVGSEAKSYFTAEGAPADAGFQSVTVPEISLEATEYREGTYKYTRKYPGPPTISEVSCIRGVTKTDTGFFDWCVAAMSGSEYRADISIIQYARENLADAGDGPDEYAFSEIPLIGARNYVCRECVPIRVKPAGDMEAMSGEVSLAEVGLCR